MNKWKYCEFVLSSLTFYDQVAQDELVIGLKKLLSSDNRDGMELVSVWSKIYRKLVIGDYRGSMSDYLFEKVLFDDNLFTRECAKGNFDQLDPRIKSAVLRDLYGLSVVASLDCEELKEYLCTKLDVHRSFIYDLPDWTNVHQLYYPADSWDKDIVRLAEFAKNNGFGIFAQYYAFECNPQNSYFLMPVKEMDRISLKDLKEYETQRNIVIDNTLSLLSGHAASNILLYGDRGTGKSSTVKAIANEFVAQGLKIVQIFKKDIGYLRDVLEILSDLPFKFIIFLDDLTFEEDDKDFSTFKAVLEGSLVKRNENIVIYVTSNRRHLVKESFSSRGNDDIHRSDTIHETVSLSDRFGITVTFTVPNKQKFYEIVLLLAADHQIVGRDEELKAAANRYACKKGDFSPRTARQFIDYAVSRLERGLSIDENGK